MFVLNVNVNAEWNRLNITVMFFLVGMLNGKPINVHVIELTRMGRVGREPEHRVSETGRGLQFSKLIVYG